MSLSADLIIQSLIVAAVSGVCAAVVTGYVSGKVLESKLVDMKQRIERIEKYLNGLLKK